MSRVTVRKPYIDLQYFSKANIWFTYSKVLINVSGFQTKKKHCCFLLVCKIC